MYTQSFPALCSVETVNCQMTLVPKNEAFTVCVSHIRPSINDTYNYFQVFNPCSSVMHLIEGMQVNHWFSLILAIPLKYGRKAVK